MTRAIFVLAIVVALTEAARSFLPPGVAVTGSGAALAFGFVLLAAIQTGHIFHDLRLPHLTGYLLCGLCFGPEVVGLLTSEMVHDMTMVKGTAVALIALSAGCELNFESLRPRLKAIGIYAAGGMLLAFLLIWALLFALSPRFPFAEGMTAGQRVVVSLIGANVLVALSPAVVMGILSETRAAGPLSSLALSIVVLADLIVAVTFSFSESIANAAFGRSASQAQAVGSLLWHILGSFAVGIGAGAVLGIYVSRVGKRVALFCFGVAFLFAEVGHALHVDPLLTGLAAGLFLENVSPVGGHRVIREIEPAAMPTFAIFFAVIGAQVHLHEFFAVAVYGVAAALVRAVGMWFGVQAAGRLSGLDPWMTRRIPFGMFPQAGIALALANLVGQKFASWGTGLSTLLLGTIVVNEMVGPVLWRLALDRAGEIGRREGAEAAGHARAETTRLLVAAPAPDAADRH